ncbi:hypothetical protein [Cetobacterium sp.]|uniref:hypothetical protein n=1 Tax=Cetobacterium sp. TaxID=2071632 RepID=UPI003F3D1DDB
MNLSLVFILIILLVFLFFKLSPNHKIKPFLRKNGYTFRRYFEANRFQTKQELSSYLYQVIEIKKISKGLELTEFVYYSLNRFNKNSVKEIESCFNYFRNYNKLKIDYISDSGNLQFLVTEKNEDLNFSKIAFYDKDFLFIEMYLTSENKEILEKIFKNFTSLSLKSLLEHPKILAQENSNMK